MGIKITFECGGCDAAEVVRVSMVIVAEVPSGTYYRQPKIEDATPKGWVAFDPFTHCCYCPTCWADIMAPKESAAP